MKRTMAVFPPVCGKEGNRSVREDMMMRDSNAFNVCVQEVYICRVLEQKSVGVLISA